MHPTTFSSAGRTSRRLGTVVAAATAASAITFGLSAMGLTPIGFATATSDSQGGSFPGASQWTGAWASGQQELTETTFGSVADTTLRLLIHPTTGGTSLRVRLANTFGEDDVVITAASVAVAAVPGEAALKAGTRRTLTFGGETEGTIAEGARLLSDPVKLKISFGDTLAVDLHVASAITGPITGHNSAGQGSCRASGDHVGESAGDAFTCDLWQWYLLDGVDVASAGKAPGSVVALGDSITDGAYSSWNQSKRWPDVLAQRIQADPWLRGTGVLNQGIGGNQVLTYRGDCCGTSESALARFDRDVIAQTSVKTLIIADGINDLGYNAPANKLIAGLKQLATRARTSGITVIGTTITPYGCDSGCFGTQQEADRQTVNAWIRTTGSFDAFVDFDKAVRDPANPARLLAAYDAGDHLHLNDAGYAALANSIPLRLLR